MHSNASNCLIQLSTRTGSSPDIFVTDDGSSPTRMNHRYASSDASGTSPDSVRIPTHNYKVRRGPERGLGVCCKYLVLNSCT